MKKFKKGAVEIEFIVWLAIALMVGFIIITGILILKGKGYSAVDYLKNLFHYGG
ncbi:Uncharacterised protein [uncultured archaeon]|nr:Uncharacterised protein [uncultured archaeon]